MVAVGWLGRGQFVVIVGVVIVSMEFIVLRVVILRPPAEVEVVAAVVAATAAVAVEEAEKRPLECDASKVSVPAGRTATAPAFTIVASDETEWLEAACLALHWTSGRQWEWRRQCIVGRHSLAGSSELTIQTRRLSPMQKNLMTTRRAYY